MPISLLDKVSMLVSSNLQSMVGQVHQTHNPSHFFRHYLQVEEQLVEVDDALKKLAEEAQTLQQKGARCSEQKANLDKIIDGFLLQKREAEALKAQYELNTLAQLDAAYRTQARQLDAQRQNLLKARDTLEARLSLMQEERAQLEAYLAEFRAQNGQAASPDPAYWVVEPDEAEPKSK